MREASTVRVTEEATVAVAANDAAAAAARALPRLTLVVPCYNEELALPMTAEALSTLLFRLINEGKIHAESQALLVDDGSRDQTWALIEAAHEENPRIRGLKLSRNFGHQHALLAGLMAAEGDITISLDADLQDDLAAVDRMLEAHARGADIVCGVRSRRDVDTPFKRMTAQAFYRGMSALGVSTIPDHADYRLMSRKAVEALRGFGEVNLFLRGIVPTLGFKIETVHYERKARVAGETHYPLRKMLALAANGVFAFSTVPLKLITVLGFVVCAVAFAMGCWALGVRLLTSQSVPGWASVVIPMYFLGGVQMLSIGILGAYISRTYAETKQRPRFIIEKTL